MSKFFKELLQTRIVTVTTLFYSVEFLLDKIKPLINIVQQVQLLIIVG